MIKKATKEDIEFIELSYLAQNSIAENVWSKLGFIPFRVFANKEI